MDRHMQFQIPDGFRVICKEEKLDILDAGQVLRSTRQRKYTAAYRKGDTATLVRHVVRCPFCGHELPAYDHFLNEKIALPQRIPDRVVDAWASPQYSFFDEDDTSLECNSLRKPVGKYVCRKCGGTSTAFCRMQEVRLGLSEKKVTVSCPFTRTQKLLELMKRNTRGSVRLRFPLTETVTFNLKNGRVSLKIAGADGTAAAVFDITFGREHWLDSEVYALIRDYPLIRRKLHQLFSRVYGGDLPFGRDELTGEIFVAMTQFVGYSRMFYDAVPYDLSRGTVGRSFRNVSRQLQNAKNLPELYDRSGLPKMKSVRRLIFSSPELLFYLREVQELWNLLGDPNRFLRLLSMSRAYELLSFLHQYPGVMEFLRDYLEVKGPGCLLDRLERKLDATQAYAVNYCSMGPSQRKRERKGWNGKRILAERRISHSIPMQRGPKQIRDCCLDGYSFFWLRTKWDYARAGKALHNCLVEWRSRQNPVVAVKRGERYMAAIEVENDQIVQVRGFDNEPVEHDEELNKVIEKWKNLNKLKPVRFILGDDDDEDEDELWF